MTTMMTSESLSTSEVVKLEYALAYAEEAVRLDNENQDIITVLHLYGQSIELLETVLEACRRNLIKLQREISLSAITGGESTREARSSNARGGERCLRAERDTEIEQVRRLELIAGRYQSRVDMLRGRAFPSPPVQEYSAQILSPNFRKVPL